MQHTPHAKDVRVDGRQRRGQDYEVEDPGGKGNPHMLERQNERATVSADLVPRVNRHDDEQRPHVKHEDTHRYGIDGARNRFFRVFGFASGNPNNLNPAVGEHHHL